MSINLTARCKESFWVAVGKTCPESGLWPHPAIASLNLPLWGTHWAGVSQVAFTPAPNSCWCFLARRATQSSASCSSVLAQSDSWGRKLSWSDHQCELKDKSLVMAAFRSWRETGGPQSKEVESGKGKRGVCVKMCWAFTLLPLPGSLIPIQTESESVLKWSRRRWLKEDAGSLRQYKSRFSGWV